MKKNQKQKNIKYPEKRYINLAIAVEKRTNWFLAIPGIIIIVILAALLSKVAVVDRMSRVSKAQSEVNELQAQVDSAYEAYNSMGEIKEEYEHYTFSYLTEEEKQYTDRIDVVDLVEAHIMNKAVVNTWQVSGNTLTVPMRADDLDTVKNIILDLNEQDMVNYCVMTNANTTEATDEEEGYVTARVLVYLNAPGEEAAEEQAGE